MVYELRVLDGCPARSHVTLLVESAYILSSKLRFFWGCPWLIANSMLPSRNMAGFKRAYHAKISTLGFGSQRVSRCAFRVVQLVTDGARRQLRASLEWVRTTISWRQRKLTECSRGPHKNLNLRQATHLSMRGFGSPFRFVYRFGVTKISFKQIIKTKLQNHVRSAKQERRSLQPSGL
jgi:hypothetical protein